MANNSFIKHLNAQIQIQILNKNAFFLKNNEHPYYIIDTLTRKIFNAENWTAIQINNNKLNKDYTEYISLDAAIKCKEELKRSLSSFSSDRMPQGIPISSDSKILMYSPTVQYDQNIIKDDYRNQRRLPHYIPFQSFSTEYENVEAFFTEQLENYYNAACTKTPFKTNTNYPDIISRLITKISLDPYFVSNCSKNANEEVDHYHYIPINREKFLQKARDIDSKEFHQLSASIARHVTAMHINSIPSFNYEFTELSRPLLEVLKHKSLNNIDSIEQETRTFVIEKIQHDKYASILIDTFLGTIIERMKKLPKETKKIAAAIILGTALIGYPSIKKDLQADNTKNVHQTTIVSSINKSISVTSASDEINISDEDVIIINSETFRGKELKKILDFDKQPFDINNDGLVNALDYQTAYQAEKIIINKKVPVIEQEKYIHEKEMKHIVSVTEKINKRYNIDKNMPNLSNVYYLVFGQIAGILQKEGDTILIDSVNNSRTFFSYLDYLITQKPDLLDHVVRNIDLGNQHQTITQSSRAGNRSRK
jgi:hypothetical protein